MLIAVLSLIMTYFIVELSDSLNVMCSTSPDLA